MVEQTTPAPKAQQDYPIKVEVAYPEKLSRLSTFFRFILIIPHYIVLALLGVAAFVVVFIAWFAILFTGKFPKGLFKFSEGYLRWYTRYTGYSIFLTDKYPPFKME